MSILNDSPVSSATFWMFAKTASVA